MNKPDWIPSEILIDTANLAEQAHAAVRSAATSNVQPVVPPVQVMRTPLEIVKTSYELIADREHWIKHTLAVRADGTRCQPEDEAADKWCTIGAFKAVLHHEPEEHRAYLEQYIRSMWNAANPTYMLERPAIEGVNDTHSHEVVKRCFERLMLFFVRHPEANDPYPNRNTRREAIRAVGRKS